MRGLSPNLALLGPVCDLEELREFCDSLVASTCSITEILVCYSCFDMPDGEGYGLSLGRALAHNTSVTSLNIAMQGLLKRRQEDSSNDMVPILQYLATSASLCVVSLSGGDGREVLTDRVLNAVDQNSNITHLRVWEDLYPGPESFLQFLTTARFICKMELNVIAFSNHSLHEVGMLATAVAEKQTLRELRLTSVESSDNGIGELILWQLGSVQNQLTLLQVAIGNGAPITQLQALASVLVSSQTLSHLMLKEYSFNSDSIEVFLGAFLTMEDVEMTKAPFELWTQFLQSSDSLIHEIHLRPAAAEENWREAPEQEIRDLLDTSVAGTGLLSMLTRSSVHVLSLQDDVHGWVPGYDSLFDGLARKESEMQLLKLTITTMDATTMAALIEFLSQATLLDS
jgi:hypothetical protein